MSEQSPPLQPEAWWKGATGEAVARALARFDGRADYLSGPVTDDEYRLYGELPPATAAALVVVGRNIALNSARDRNTLLNAIGSAAGQ